MTKFQVILMSSVRGEIRRRSASSRGEAFTLARQLLVERKTDEAPNDLTVTGGEILSVRVESDCG